MEAGLRGTSIDLCIDDYAFDLTRPAGFACFGSISRLKRILWIIIQKCDVGVVAAAVVSLALSWLKWLKLYSTNNKVCIYTAWLKTDNQQNTNATFTLHLILLGMWKDVPLRLVINEILRCKPGSLVILAPDCRSLSRMHRVDVKPTWTENPNRKLRDRMLFFEISSVYTYMYT